MAEASRAEAGFEPIETYIQQSQNTAAQYISTQSLLYLCEVSERKQGERVGMKWWEQVVIYLEEARELAAAALAVEANEYGLGD